MQGFPKTALNQDWNEMSFSEYSDSQKSTPHKPDKNNIKMVGIPQ